MVVEGYSRPCSFLSWLKWDPISCKWGKWLCILAGLQSWPTVLDFTDVVVRDATTPYPGPDTHYVQNTRLAIDGSIYKRKSDGKLSIQLCNVCIFIGCVYAAFIFKFFWVSVGITGTSSIALSQNNK